MKRYFKPAKEIQVITVNSRVKRAEEFYTSVAKNILDAAERGETSCTLNSDYPYIEDLIDYLHYIGYNILPGSGSNLVIHWDEV